MTGLGEGVSQDYGQSLPSAQEHVVLCQSGWRGSKCSGTRGVRVSQPDAREEVGERAPRSDQPGRGRALTRGVPDAHPDGGDCRPSGDRPSHGSARRGPPAGRAPGRGSRRRGEERPIARPTDQAAAVR